MFEISFKIVNFDANDMLDPCAKFKGTVCNSNLAPLAVFLVFHDCGSIKSSVTLFNCLKKTAAGLSRCPPY